jgi:peptide deformylase
VEGESELVSRMSQPARRVRSVPRGTRATIAGTTLDGERIEITGEGLLARAIQHEMDHLNGHLFIDHLSPARRKSAIQEYKRKQKHEEE